MGSGAFDGNSFGLSLFSVNLQFVLEDPEVFLRL